MPQFGSASTLSLKMIDLMITIVQWENVTTFPIFIQILNSLLLLLFKF